MPTSTAEPGLEQKKQVFREYLREADRFILEHQFQKARQILAKARELFPENTYLAAFEERILVFEAKETAPSPQSLTQEKIVSTQDASITPGASIESVSQHLEDTIRHNIEEEYQKRYTEELRKVESRTRELFEQDRSKLERERAEIECTVAQCVAESRHQLEQEYQQKLRSAVIEAEQQLDQQFAKRLHALEEETTARMTARYDEGKKKLEERFQAEIQTLLERERQASEVREGQLKEDDARALRHALEQQEHLKTQSEHQQKERSARLKEQLEKEHQAALGRERTAMEQHYNQMSAELAERFQVQQDRLRKEFDSQLREEVETMRRKETALFEEQRATAQRELELQMQQKYEKQLETERIRIEQDSQGALNEEKKRLQAEFTEMVEMQNENVRQIRIEVQQQMEQEFVERLNRLAHESEQKLELLGAHIPESHADRLAFYRNALRPFYQSGMPNVEQVTRIMQLKELLELTFDEHLQVESEVRLDLYVEAVQQSLHAGTEQVPDSQKLDELKQRFGIAPEESAQLEPRMLALLQRYSSKRRILVADDEKLLLSSVADLLQGHGFHVITAGTVEDALEKVMKFPVDLILSDIKFGADDLDGFKFFDAVQRVPALCSIPFIFMSSLREGVIVRSGMLMGIDDYLTKPLDPELLLAVIEGKLRRARSTAMRQKT